MGRQDRTSADAWVDVAAMRAVANQFDAAAQLIGAAARSQLGRLVFDGARAGQAHIARGDALRTGLDRLAADLSQWSRAAIEIAGALRVGADHYADAELRAAARIG
jgi:Excreted virulence factor EspC, type VII ESX diderm